jgi:hypothetical protein
MTVTTYSEPRKRHPDQRDYVVIVKRTNTVQVFRFDTQDAADSFAASVDLSKESPR